MRRTAKIKAVSTRVPLRKSALSASAAARRPFPAWIVADESGVAFTARSFAQPRVRDALVLRTVAKKKTAGASTKRSSDVHGAR
jgi:hypothetical protein